MRIDGSLAWDQAIGWARANLAMLVPLAGIFLLLPSLGLNWFSVDLQLALDAAAKQSAPGKIPPELVPLMGKFVGLTLAISFFQAIGTMAMLALYGDQTRPTVGEALARALQCLPTAIGVTALLIVAAVIALVPFALVVGLLAAVLAMVIGAAASALVAGAMFGAIILAAARLFLISPVIVIEGERNPLAAIRRSWDLTRGNTWSLAFFLFLLGLGYIVIVLLVQAVMGMALGVGAMVDTIQLNEAGSTARLAIGLVLGVIGAVAGVVFTGISGAIHGQLAGPRPERLGQTFD